MNEENPMLLESILPRVQFDAAEGALILNGARYLLIRPDTIAGFQKQLEIVAPGRAGEVIGAGGRVGGRLSAQKLYVDKKLSAEQTVLAMCAMGTQIGWGAFRLMAFSHKPEQFEITVRSSPWAQAHGESPSPVCHLIAGVFTGVAEVVFGHALDVEETECIATGRPVCRFMTVLEEKS